MALVEVMLKEGGLITMMDDSELVRSTGVVDDEVEHTEWVEYRLKSDPEADRPVHRSVNMRLKQMPPLFATAASLQ